MKNVGQEEENEDENDFEELHLVNEYLKSKNDEGVYVRFFLYFITSFMLFLFINW